VKGQHRGGQGLEPLVAFAAEQGGMSAQALGGGEDLGGGRVAG
jgi:hypothetical protein